MSELALNILRVGFVGLLWLFLIFLLYVLWQGLKSNDVAEVYETKWPAASKSEALRRLVFRTKPTELIVRTGTSQGTRIPLAGDKISIGRSDDNTLILDEDFISDHHATLRKADNQWLLEDLASTNGTWLRGERVTLARPIKVGWLFGVGDVVLEVK